MERRYRGHSKNPGTDFHIHTLHSRKDNCLNPSDLVEGAAETFLNCLAVTNHNTIAGADETRRFAKESGIGLVVITGEEITTKEENSAGKKIELLGYFLKETIPAGLSIEQTLVEIYKQGGLVGIPHPFELWRHGAGEKAAEIIAQAQRIGFEVILWEIFNSRSSPENNYKAESFFMENMKRYSLLPIAGTDSHSPWEVGGARSLWLPRCETPEELIKGLINVTHYGTWYEGDDNRFNTLLNRTRTKVVVYLNRLVRIHR